LNGDELGSHFELWTNRLYMHRSIAALDDPDDGHLAPAPTVMSGFASSHSRIVGQAIDLPAAAAVEG
jgi:hypothetical protein